MEETHTAPGDATSSADEGRQPATESAPERLTIGLIPKAVSELKTLQAETRMSRSELINRAVGLYSFVTKQLDSGAELAIHFPSTGETRIVHVT